MKIGVPKEVHTNECRVAATPASVQKLIKLGYEVSIETGAGTSANYFDDAYQAAGASIVDSVEALWKQSDVVLKVRPPEKHPELNKAETELLAEDKTLISFLWPAQNKELISNIEARKATALAVDTIPRISRAQKMDALSSMANIAGYRAVIEAANQFGRFFTGQITAAGKVPPAKVMVIGAGVAGLAAIGAARALGAIVRAFDTRPEVREQVESMGAEFLELDFEEDGSGEGGYAKEMSPAFIEAEMALFAQQAMEVDIIITTALIPGKKAPELLTSGMIESMKPGSVVVDLAAEQGGNCRLTEAGKVVVKHGVSLIGYTDLPSRMANVSSELYATNLVHLLTDLTPEKNGCLTIDLEDDVQRGATVVKSGVIKWPPPPPKTPPATPPPSSEQPHPEPPIAKEPEKASPLGKLVPAAIAALALYGVGAYAPESFMSHFTVFVLSCFIGWQVIWNVTPALHTPLMSVTNAISGIIVIGALLHLAQADNSVILVLSFLAVLIASINIAGGFLVTQRMLKMFRK
jgi:NAD(P) transhydrogenase subunit alpha